MMKKVLLIVVAMVLMAGAANAYTIQAISGNSTYGSSTAQITFGTAAAAVKNPLAANTGTLSEVSLTDPDGSGRFGVWNVLAANAPKDNTWNLKLTAASGFTGTSIFLKFWAVSTADAVATKDWVVKANGVQVGQTFKLMSAVSAKATPAWAYEFKFADFGDLKTTPLNLTIGEAVPEPGSMVAMFSGLVGLVGFGIRRRK